MAADELQQTLAPFLTKHCLRCHGENEPEGQVRVDQLDWDISNNNTAQRWQDLLDVLNASEMPPEDEEQPSTEELVSVLRVLTKSVEHARKRLTDTGGEIAMRRLNRREYAGTIRELIGLRIPLELIPADAESDSFDTVGADQYFTSSHFEQYLELSTGIVKKAFSWADKPRKKLSVQRNDPEGKINRVAEKRFKEQREKLALIQRSKSWKEAGFSDEGEMNLFINRSKKESVDARYLSYPRIREGQYLAPPNHLKRATMNLRADPRATYRFRIHGGVREGQIPLRHFVGIHRGNDLDVVKVMGTESNPKSVEITTSLPFGSTGLISMQILALHGQDKKTDPDGDWAPIWIDYMEFEGPIYPQDRSFFETLIYPTEPTRGKNKLPWNDKNAEQLIRQFAQVAFRGVKPSERYVAKLAKLFAKNRTEGQSFQQAITEPLAIVLASPQFLFVQESKPASSGRQPLSDRELAIRLAYFLWSCPPDQRLKELVAQGTLSSDVVLRQQVNRMLDDPKADAFFEGFASQWAELDRFDAITVDPKKFLKFSDGLRQSARREVVEFFKLMVQEDLPVDNLIDSNFVVVDALLQQHYELENSSSFASGGFEKLSLSPKSPRGGLLGQMAFLTLGSNGERSSPVIRGAWVLDKILHDPPSPPPPNVPELGAASRTPVTNRQMVVLHQKQVVCYSCHKKMDGIGFGFENFDTIGRWRDTESVRKKQVRIEPGGTLASGESFQDIHELKKLLLAQKHHLAQELCESLTAYGIGRTIEFSDSGRVRAILETSRGQDFRIRSMISEIVVSSLFRTK
ncbi:MAG: DUF1592 domain-containing protein [Fuerstiella sp.]